MSETIPENESNFGWWSTLAYNLKVVGVDWANCQRFAAEETREFLRMVTQEWRVLVRDVRFSYYGGVDTPECRREYVTRRVAEYRRGLIPYFFQPSARALDQELKTAEIE